MAEAIINVDPQVLRTTSESFNTNATSVQNITSEMMTLITGLSSQWEGDASTAYINKFKSLEDDINKLINKIHEHVKDLLEIAQIYEQAEAQSMEAANALSDSVIS